jgi:hypothetical protein
MRTALVTAGISVALVLSLVAVWLGGKPPRLAGGGDVQYAGTWCCVSCMYTGGVLNCTGCSASPPGGGCAGSAGGTLVNCTGNTTQSPSGNVICY